MLELVLTVLLLAIMFLVVFMLFKTSTGAFRYAVTRQGLQNEGRRIMNSLDADMRQTDFHSVAVANDVTRRVSPGSLARHGLCFVGIYDWSQPAALDTAALQPNWDHYIVYYATTDKPYGRLIRTVLQPPSSEISGLPYGDFVANPGSFLSNTPKLNPNVQKRYEVLSNNIEVMNVQSSNVVAGMNFQLVLKEAARRLEPSRDSLLSFELHFDITPENTRPRR